MQNPWRTAVSVLIGTACVALLLPALSRAGGSKPAPVKVTFGPNINLSVQPNSQGKVQRENTIAVNPTDPDNLVQGNMDHVPKPYLRNCSFSFSFDGGKTWTFGGSVPREAADDSTGDPALTADADGNFYYSYLDNNSASARHDLVVARSTDGGRTFPGFSVVFRGTFDRGTYTGARPDKDYIAADSWAGSPYRNNVYVAWTNLIARLGYQITVAVSRDGGTTWSDPIAITPPSATEVLLDALPVVGPDGTVYLFYDGEPIDGAGPASIRFAKSTDGGQTWTAPQDVAANLPGPASFRLKNSDPHWYEKEIGGIFASSYPTAAVSADGTIFVAWTDLTNGSCIDDGSTWRPCTNPDVWLAFSKNGGRTWSAPIKVSDETNATDQFFPWLAVHPNGLVSLSWVDKRLDPDNVNYDVYYTNTFDGVSFLPNVRVTTATSLSGNLQTEIMDYNGMAATADSVFPVWTDMRTGNPDIYVAAGRLKP